MRFFAPCPRGSELLLAAELVRVGASRVVETAGGVAFAGDQAVMLRANLYSRFASRVLVEVASGPLPAHQPEGDALYRLAREADWHKWLTPEDRLRVNLTALGATRDALPFLTLRVKDGVCDAMRARFGRRPSVDKENPTARVVAHLKGGRATLYWDSSGPPLFQRGYKVAKVAAPLKEHLAAAILAHLGWPAAALPLCDPMCGSGTFLLEGALMAAGAAPGWSRSFAFEGWSGLDRALWQQVRAAAWAESRSGWEAMRKRLFWGSDCDPQAVAAAQTNWAALAAAFDLNLPAHWAVVAAEALDPPAPAGVWVANPPYGVRLAEAEALAAWYPVLGNALKRRWSGWLAHFFTADPQLAKRLGLRPARKVPFRNGALTATLLSYPLVAGAFGKGSGPARQTVSGCCKD